MLLKLISWILPSFHVYKDVNFRYIQNDSLLKAISLNRIKVNFIVKKKIIALRKKSRIIEIQKTHSKKLGIIVPFRNRNEHLKKFIPAITEHLNNQEINFRILIINQVDEKPFNRAKLLNVGAKLLEDEVDYFAFHDVDLLPLESVDYRYSDFTVRNFLFLIEHDGKYKESHSGFGGSTLVPKNIFFEINGFSNNYWQWGSEDDDFFMRHLFKGFVPLEDIQGVFQALPHQSSLKRNASGQESNNSKVIKNNYRLKKINQKRLSRMKRMIYSQNEDGIQQLDFKIVKRTHFQNYEIIDVEL